MSTTAQDIIKSALRKIRVLGQGQPDPSADDAAICLAELNEIFGLWNARKRLGSYQRIESFTFTTARASYTIGNSADSPNFAVSSGGAPVSIESAAVVDTSQTPNLDIEIAVITDAQYNALSIPALTGLYPTSINYRGTSPNGTIYPYPSMPTNTSWKLKLRWWNQLDEITIANIGAALQLPTGAVRALSLTLAQALRLPYAVKDDGGMLDREAGIARADFSAYFQDPPYISATIGGAGGDNWMSRT